MKKEVFLKDIKNGTEIKISLMVMRVIFRDTSKVVCILADKTGEIKATIPNKTGDIIEGKVIEIEGKRDVNLEVKKYALVKEYNAIDYLPTVKREYRGYNDWIELYTDEYINFKKRKGFKWLFL